MTLPPDSDAPITLSTEGYQNEYVLACPVCRNLYVSPTLVEVSNIEGHTTCVITAEGIATQNQQSPSGRGVVIAHGYQCEHGHSWITTYTFHKGMVTVETDAGAANIPEHTIWRD